MARIEEQKEGNSTWFLAYDDEGKFLGGAKTIVSDGKFTLDGISVLPEYRGNGIGRELLGYVKNQCKSMGFGNRMFGEFDPDPGREDDLKRFYLRNGFNESGEFSET